MSNPDNKAAHDLTRAMEETMQLLQGRFQAISDQLETKLDEMGSRINGLEKNVAELVTQAGMDQQSTPK
ncbi:heat shock factor-binding protein 1-like protein 1 [Synchiropus splendidus]|uniref:heat shock factor-binding protein 1-like protein 1 n=1 Tax=Synchiropus splendidus TaxID=270530 RepID=UPI00237DD129|nr:heat shock factor-binding protein 1-like protein 1 [Synchiropus splendidus]